MRVFPDETDIWIGRMSKAVYLLNVGGPHPIRWRSDQNEKTDFPVSKGKHFLPSCCELRHCFYSWPATQNETWTTQKNVINLLMKFHIWCLANYNTCHIKGCRACTLQSSQVSITQECVKNDHFRTQPPTVQNSPPWGQVPSYLCFNQPARQFWSSVQFKNHSKPRP